jgi:predicted NBD/HSP70 family sugar kinase
MSRVSPKTLLVTAVEAFGVRHSVYRNTGGTWERHEIDNDRWDCSPYFTDPTGVRLMEEVVRRSRRIFGNLGEEPTAIALTLPGTLEGTTTIQRSTRLGILEPINISELFRDRSMPPCHVLHDTECLAIGEARYGPLREEPGMIAGREEFAFIYADEGIGTIIFLDGRVYRGAGNAGRIGRLVVAPEGAYNRSFKSRGPLELFAARPWVSANIVGELLAEQGKVGEATTGDRTFRAAVSATARGDWTTLTFQQIARGITCKDPVAVTIIEEAARYLGLAVHAVLTVVHPFVIILGGGMITDLPGFGQSVMSHARRFSYDVAWNKTVIRLASLGREAQLLGARELLLPLVDDGG